MFVAKYDKNHSFSYSFKLHGKIGLIEEEVVLVLIDFTVENFTSFKTATTLSAETGERLSRLKQTNTLTENGYTLLKNLLIFGPNGSGKTNLLMGLRTMQRMVLDNPAKVTSKLPARPYALDEAGIGQPVCFAVTFNYLQATYAYTFSFTTTAITSEKLCVKHGQKMQTYFEREGQEYPVLPASLRALKATTKQNTLFLFNAQQVNDPHATAVMQWFQNDLLFVDDAQVSDQLVTMLEQPAVKEEFLHFLHFADFNIVDIRPRRVATPPVPQEVLQLLQSADSAVTLPTTMPQLFTVHQKYNAAGEIVGQEELPLASESRGTQKIFVIGLSIINAQLNGNGKTLLFDEFDDSLHFELTKALIKIFNSEPNKNQFILTTHELQLLNAALRIDQIYLVEKNFQGTSDLKSIFDFSDVRTTARRDVSFMKRYIEGRFGAMPAVNADEMLLALEEVKNNGERE